MSMVDNGRQRSTRSDPAHDASTDPHGDPLAELARLIGQDDLFDQMKKDAARSDMRAAAAPRAPARRQPEWSQPEASTTDLRSSFDELGHEVNSSFRRTETRSYPHGDPLAGSYGSTPRRDPAARQERQEAAARYAPPARQQDYSLDEDRYSLRDERDTGYEHRHAASSGYADPYAGYGQQAQHHQAYAEQPQAPAQVYPAQQAAAQHDAYDQQADARGYDQPAYAHDAQQEPPYEEAYYDEAPPPERRRGGMMAVAAVVGLAVIGTAGAFGYRAMTGSGSSGQPPVIKADNAPAKVVPPPQTANGQPSKLTYDRTEKPQGERVVSREEQPIDIKAATAPKMVTTSTVAATGSTGVPAQVAAYAPSSSNLSSGVEPKKVRTFAIRPDGATAPSAAARPGAQPSAAPTRTASIPPTAAPAAPPAGSYVVQLVSNKSENEAQAAFKGLQSKYPGVLGSRQALIRRVDLGDKGTYYRAQVGPFANVDQANDLCGNLKAAGGQCIVQRN